MRMSSDPNCCGVRFLSNLYDYDTYGRRVEAQTLIQLKAWCTQRKMYLAFFAGGQINNQTYKACIEFGFKKYPEFRNTTGNKIHVLFWIHPGALIKPKKKPTPKRKRK